MGKCDSNLIPLSNRDIAGKSKIHIRVVVGDRCGIVGISRQFFLGIVKKNIIFQPSGMADVAENKRDRNDPLSACVLSRFAG